MAFRDSINMRRFPGACEHYRENWTVDDSDVLYQIYCLRGTAPSTREEQERCLNNGKRRCWREEESKKGGRRADYSAARS
ncbi:MAG: hypothetical protein M0Z94_11860 [Dehalococcoidales bacterium]|nr:hypothetical protein [Dehalococcoidales bacterium]